MRQALRKAVPWLLAGKRPHPASQSRNDLRRILQNLVVIKFSHTLPFDGDSAGASEATGFVVDARRGYIVTNRHVAGPGPFWGLCIFGQEAVACQPVYIDPVHDFALLRYDPAGIQHTHVDGLATSADGATVNQRVLVVGNDAGEADSIIDGTISCVNRNAPEYAGSYSDFNISYYVANMKATGGISGSPAVREDGSVIGVVSGVMTDGAICYLLPIRPVARALQCLQQGRSVSRGDLQCRFTLTPLHECRGLGLDAEWEGRLRRKVARSGGLLVARDVLAGGPSGGRIAPGDILLDVDGAIALQFEELETILNDNVDGQVPVSLLRGGELVLAILDVVNLHQTVPRRLVSFGGLFCHDLSYLQAIQYSAAARGVYVAESQEPLMIGDGEPGWLVQKLNGQAVHGVDELLDRLRACNKGQGVVVTYAHLESPHRSSTSLMTFDPPTEIAIFSQDETTGVWGRDTARLRPAKLALTPPIADRIPPLARFPDVLRNLISVESRSDIPLDGYKTRLARGMGVVVDACAGLAVVSRNVVPHKACRITVTLGSHADVEARCFLLHVSHCYTVIQYDASRVPHPAADIPLGGRARYGAEATFLSFRKHEQVWWEETPVQSVVLTRSLRRRPSVSYLRCYPWNADLVGLEAPAEIERADGVVVGPDGSVQAIWMPGIGGLAAESLAKILARLRREPSPPLYVLPAEVEIITARHASTMGVPGELIRAVVGSRRDADLFRVKGALSNQLEEGDIFMALNGKQPTRWADFDVHDAGTMPARVWRQDGPRDLVLSCVRVDDMQTTRCVRLCGAFIQPTPLTVRWWLHLGDRSRPRGIYITHVLAGSTAALFDLPAESFVTKINGKMPQDFEAFVAMAKALPDGQAFAMTTVTLGGRESVCVLRPNNGHHPFVEWEFNGTEFVENR